MTVCEKTRVEREERSARPGHAGRAELSGCGSSAVGVSLIQMVAKTVKDNGCLVWLTTRAPGARTKMSANFIDFCRHISQRGIDDPGFFKEPYMVIETPLKH